MVGATSKKGDVSMIIRDNASVGLVLCKKMDSASLSTAIAITVITAPAVLVPLLLTPITTLVSSTTV